MIALVVRVGAWSARVARLVVPDPYVIALLLAAVVLVAGFAIGEKTPLEIVSAFSFGFLESANIAFAFQMVLVLLTGGAIATAPVVDRALRRLADRPTTGGGAAALVVLGAMLTSLFNWGLGLIVGAVLAREVGRSFARRGLPLHYGVIGAAGYMGIAVWHGGFSGSAPLKVAVDGPFGAAIPVSATLLSPLNLVVTALLLVAFVALFAALGRTPPDASVPAPPAEAATAAAASPDRPVGAERLERNALVLLVVTLPLLVGVGRALALKGTGAVTLDLVILVFFVAGMLLHKSPRAYAEAFSNGAREAAGILLQFPLYFGIVAAARDSGLVHTVARAFVDLAVTLDGALDRGGLAGLLTYASACLINFLVPSGGGQWVVQSPLILQMSQELAVERAPLVLAFAYGDQTTNLLQPFWALPLLSITGLRARDIMGFTMVALVVELLIVVPCLLAFS